MNYRYSRVCRLVVCLGFALTTAMAMASEAPELQKMPKDNFKVIVKKDPKVVSTFYYVFCMTNRDDDLYICSLNNKDVTPRSMPLVSTSRSISSKNLSSFLENKNSLSLETRIRLVVSTDPGPLKRKVTGQTSDADIKAITASPAIKFYKTDNCTGDLADLVIEGSVTFTVSEQISGENSKLTVAVNDARTCKISRTAQVKHSVEAAWESTKEKATRAKTKVGRAASRIKASVRSRLPGGSREQATTGEPA